MVKENQGLDWKDFSFNHNPKTDIDTSDWFTYRNEKYGWEIKYPKEWQVKNTLAENTSFGPIKTSGPRPFILIEKYPKENTNNLSVEEFRKQLGWINWNYRIELDEGEMYGVSMDDLKIYNPFLIIDLMKGKNFFEIIYGVNFGKDEVSYSIFIAMLSTFHFYK